MSDQNRKNTKRSRNAWKRYGAIFMAGLFMAGTAAGAGVWAETAYAEEEQRITMRTADDEKDQPVTRKTSEEDEERLTLKTADKDKSDKEDDKEDEKSDKKEDKEDEKSDKKDKEDKDDKKSDDKEDEDEKKSDKKEDKDDEKSDKEDKEELDEKTDEDSKKSDKNDDKDDEKDVDEESDDSHAELKTVKTTDGEIATVDFSEVVENVAPSIVLIENTVEDEAQENAAAEQYEGSFADGLYLQGEPEAQAPAGEPVVSGIVIAQNDEELLIATNSYIVSETNDLKVWFAADENEKEAEGIPAKIKGVDQGDGLAVVAVQLSDIPKDVYEEIKIAAFGSSEDMKVGQPVLAVGHEAQYGCNVTSGIVSALDREFEIGDIDTQAFVVDAPALYESSGGAILNTKGEVIGISVAYEEGSIGYAVPVDAALPVLERLASKETRDKMDNVERGYLGATVVNVNEDAKDLYNMPEGAFVYEVTEDSAADKAGIRKGDIITRFDGESVASSDDLIDKISYYAAGETVTVELQTADNGSYESREVEVTLQEGEESAAKKEEAEEEGAEEETPEVSKENSGEEETELSDEDAADSQEFSGDRDFAEQPEADQRLPERGDRTPSIDEGFRRFPFYFFNNGGF